jgi:hypothetical protein
MGDHDSYSDSAIVSQACQNAIGVGAVRRHRSVAEHADELRRQRLDDHAHPKRGPVRVAIEIELLLLGVLKDSFAGIRFRTGAARRAVQWSRGDTPPPATLQIVAPVRAVPRGLAAPAEQWRSPPCRVGTVVEARIGPPSGLCRCGGDKAL